MPRVSHFGTRVLTALTNKRIAPPKKAIRNCIGWPLRFLTLDEGNDEHVHRSLSLVYRLSSKSHSWLAFGYCLFSAKRVKNVALGIFFAPNEAKCGVSCWQSMSINPWSRNHETRVIKPYLEALLRCENMDSPKKQRPIVVPYNPPTSVSFSQTSTE